MQNNFSFILSINNDLQNCKIKTELLQSARCAYVCMFFLQCCVLFIHIAKAHFFGFFSLRTSFRPCSPSLFLCGYSLSGFLSFLNGGIPFSHLSTWWDSKFSFGFSLSHAMWIFSSFCSRVEHRAHTVSANDNNGIFVYIAKDAILYML